MEKEPRPPPASSDSDETSPPLLFLFVSVFGLLGPAIVCAMLEPNPPIDLLNCFRRHGYGGSPPWWGRGGGTVAYTFEVETVLAGEVPSVVDVTTAEQQARPFF